MSSQKLKGVILAAGKGTRLRPLTDVTDKMLLPIFDRPMIMGPIETLREFGANEICLVTRPEYLETFRNLLGDGSKLGVKINYVTYSECLGSPSALLKAEEFCKESKVLLLFGDNLFDGVEIPREALADDNAYIFLKDVNDPHRYGIAETKDGVVTRIEEKPKEPKSNHAVIGLYVYPNDVFQVAKGLKPGPNGETNITEVNNHYLVQKRLRAAEVKGYYFDTGTTESLLKASMARALTASPGIFEGMDTEKLKKILTGS